MITQLYQKYKMPILYIFFGVCTTAVNILVYALFYSLIRIGNVPSNVLAWAAAVTFAFFTNKIWVFESRQMHWDVLVREAATFISARLFTGVLDTAIMFLGVDVLHSSPVIFKIISNVLVIILNYIFSKLLIFKKE